MIKESSPLAYADALGKMPVPGLIGFVTPDGDLTRIIGPVNNTLQVVIMDGATLQDITVSLEDFKTWVIEKGKHQESITINKTN